MAAWNVVCTRCAPRTSFRGEIEMGWYELFERYVQRLRRQDIPVRVRLWSGAEAALGTSPSVTIGVPQAASLRFLIKPTLEQGETA